ncbi:MAG: Uma2 family endonuclease [Pirellulaceae bacterium]
MSTVNTPAEQRVVLHDVSWDTYLALISETDRPGKRIAYDQGVLEIMSPGMLHENAGRLIGRMIEVFTEERDIEICSSASTTFKRDDLKRGFEADESYYIANARAVRGVDEIDLSIDPPPDLAIEVDITRSSIRKFSIYGSIGVPEIWRYDGSEVHVYVLGNEETYESVKASAVLPGFPFDEAIRVLDRRHEIGETSLIRSFRGHVRQQTQA